MEINLRTMTRQLNNQIEKLGISPFTEEEQEIMDLILKAHNKFVKLNPTHPSDVGDWVDSVHGLQNVLGGRVLRRDYPETFNTTPVDTIRVKPHYKNPLM